MRWRFIFMPEPLPILVENSFRIAWGFLRASGEIGDPEEAAHFLLNAINNLVLRGEHRKLMLANKAISSYQRAGIGRRAAA